jgi:chitin disaccharide deacetylase
VTRLIVNADDFGLTPGINRSILELYRGGAMTSATLMATAKHTAEAAASITACPDLEVGCHIVLVDGAPALPPGEIPALAPSGDFRPALGSFVADLMRGRIPEAQIEHEAVAQIRRLQAMGVRVTHLDTHKHVHIFPPALRPLLRAAAECGVHAIRNPFEPAWPLKATVGAPVLRRMLVRLLRTQWQEFLRLAERARVATTDGTIGVLATGTLNAGTLEALLTRMPTGTWELVCHPGYQDDELRKVRTRLRESRATEHALLLETVPKFLREHPEVTAINFGQI